MRVCYVNQTLQTFSFPYASTERAGLVHFADAIEARRPLAVAGGGEMHAVAVLEAILESAKTGGATVRIDPLQ